MPFARPTVFVTLLMLPTFASAAEPPKGVWYGGGTASHSPSGNAGIVYALPGSNLGRGFAIRASVSGGRYDYRSSIGEKITGRYASLGAALVWQQSGAWGWLNLSGGPVISETHLSPEDLANDRRGTRLDLAIQGDGGLQHGSFDLRFIGSVTARDAAVYVRVQPGVRITHLTTIGADVGAQGDRNYTQRSFGAFVRRKVSSVDVEVRGGLIRQTGVSDRAYAGLGLSRVF